ncbi:hypothetical protein PoB_004768100 [Plakobranchus ocellatus]|uniref:Uncharacterized protein n=1 Tax=Plakobranchus ocellatus TaxID=259542 RepID=A0AAV4BCU9_9GAST|nr:hypothetical protein PoB_004768100 [Plakobranchus ocellatus]
MKKATEMWFFEENNKKISLTENKTNEEILTETNTDRSLINKTKKKQATFVLSHNEERKTRTVDNRKDLWLKSSRTAKKENLSRILHMVENSNKQRRHQGKER